MNKDFIRIHDVIYKLGEITTVSLEEKVIKIDTKNSITGKLTFPDLASARDYFENIEARLIPSEETK